MTAFGVFAGLRDRGFALTVAAGRLLVSPASNLTPADTDAILATLAPLKAVAASGGRCQGCRRPLDRKGRCWRCHDRVCSGCGRNTGSAFIELCLVCGLTGEAT